MTCLDRNPSSRSFARAAATVAAALVLCVCVPRAQAHDFWIHPSSFAPTPETTVDLRLVIGHDDIRRQFPRDVTHVFAFLCFEPSGTMKEVPGEHGQKIAGTYPVKERGLHLFAYRSNWHPAKLDPDKFAKHLKSEDLREALAEHKRQMAVFKAPDAAKKGLKPPKVIREYFARCAKSLVAVGGHADGKHDRVVGLPLEIVAEVNPLTNPAEKPLSFRVLLNGKPHANARLAAYREKHPKTIIEARTDAQGRATLTLKEPGMWVVRCIRIEHVGKPQVDWESLWATLTFARKAPETTPPAKR